MATVINNPDSGSGSGAAGWVVAGAVLIIAALVAIFVWPGYGREAAAPASPTQVNVQIPAPSVGGDSAPAE